MRFLNSLNKQNATSEWLDLVYQALELYYKPRISTGNNNTHDNKVPNGTP